MQRTQTRLRIGFGLLAMVAVLAMVAFMTMVSSNGGTTSVSALGPTPTAVPETVGVNYKVLAVVTSVKFKTGTSPNQTFAQLNITKEPNQKIAVGDAVLWKGQRWVVISRTPSDPQNPSGELDLNPNPCAKQDPNSYPQDEKWIYQPKPCNDGNLSGLYDINARAGTEEQFQCIIVADHDAKTNVIKNSAFCYLNIAGAEDPAWVLEGVNVPGEGPDCLPLVLGTPTPCSDPSATPFGAIIGPPPPPPYVNLPPQKGVGFYDPNGTSPECVSANTALSTPGAPCSVVVSCFDDSGVGDFGPNVGAMIIIPNPKGNAAGLPDVGKLKLKVGITNAECDSLNIPFTLPLYGGLNLTMTPADSTTSAVPWRVQNTGCTSDYKLCDYDGDNCPDVAELSKPPQPKNCGDDPWNPTDSNITDYGGAYGILVRVLRSGTSPGFAGIYFNCLADIQQTGNGKTDGDLQARAYCYTDGFLQVVNILDSPGVTGDGFPNGSPPFRAIPAVGPPETNCARGLAGVSLDEDLDGTQNDGCPSAAFGDLDSKHTVLTGFVDNTPGVNAIKLRGCFVDEDASSSVGTVYAEVIVNKNTGVGTADIWTQQTIANCTGTYAFGTYAAGPGGGEPNGNFNDARVLFVRQPGAKLRDTDQDGLPNAVELRDEAGGGGNNSNCGGRDPFNPYDWYDVNADGVIDLINDILGVIDHWQPTVGGAPPYDIIYDRPPTMTGALGHWNRGAPDGVIDLINDILGVIDQWHPTPC